MTENRVFCECLNPKASELRHNYAKEASGREDVIRDYTGGYNVLRIPASAVGAPGSLHWASWTLEHVVQQRRQRLVWDQGELSLPGSATN